MSMDKNFSNFVIEMILDIVMGIGLGIFIDNTSTMLASLFNLTPVFHFILQATMIIVTLYLLKKNSKYLFDAWDGPSAYGILFISLFLASQKNLIIFIEMLYSRYE